MGIETLDAATFDDAISSLPGLALVDFYADWCMPCKMLAPVLEEIARENGELSVFKVNIDQNPALATRFDIKSIPNIISFKGGEVYKRALGVQPKDSLLELTR